MALRVVYAHMVESLDLLRASWEGNLFAGLLKGTSEPDRNWTVAQLDRAIFSGYGGEQPVNNWQPAAIEDERAVSRALGIVWDHNGGPASCAITGYYIVHRNGNLQWAELFKPPFQPMSRAGNRFTLVPVYSFGSRFPTS